ncbi:UDP-N-acetylmuramoyl-L-alanine--D-glutamate ligase [Clostridia bacterium]|nr:UDP-N-acetylmuramoyl-L-alanine--D-glutamate ligase [Clostridia bacterium]
MVSELESNIEQLKEKHFLIIGAGKSGLSAAELLEQFGMQFSIFEGKPNQTEGELRLQYPFLLEAPIFLGELPFDSIVRTDIAVLSPGVPLDSPVARQLQEQGVVIWGEIELAYVLSKGQGVIAAITGTNGKTTTTALLGEIMAQAYEDVRVVGNIGNPYTKAASSITQDTGVALELSSFQLETTISFHPKVSAILNITPDHLDRHHTMEAYTLTKEAVVKNQTKDDVCVLNYEDGQLRKFAEEIKPKVFFFSSKRELSRGIYLSGNEILLANGEARKLAEAFGEQPNHHSSGTESFLSNGTASNKTEPISICRTEELLLLGTHNYENVMAAVAIAIALGIPRPAIRRALLAFRGVAHRIEYVGEYEGVRYYNDSKGTNPEAAICAIRAMNRPTLLIGGGYDKAADFTDWVKAFGETVKELILLGSTKEKIAETAKQNGFSEDKIHFAGSMEDAVRLCKEKAKEGEAVLLSPACASWGMFANYEERGDCFKELVREF